MTDPQASQRQPTEEELQAYLQQLRGADVAEILVQAYTVLGTGAEVKIGRPDARTIIDAIAAMVAAVEGGVDAQLHQQMTAGVRQLQLAQVEAERELAAAGTADQPGGQPGDAPDAAGAEPQAAGRPTAEQQRMTDRLWIPGRDPGPPVR